MATLGPAGRYAERVMRDQLAQLGIAPPPGAVARYAHAADRLARLRQAWEDAGSPALGTGSHNQPVPHPLLAELRATEATVSMLCEACGIRASAATRPGWQAGRPRASHRQPRSRLVALTDQLRP